ERRRVRRETEGRSPCHALRRRAGRLRRLGGNLREGERNRRATRCATPYASLRDARGGGSPPQEDRPSTRRMARENRIPRGSGHRGALRVDRELGSIEVGKRADLAVVSLKGAHTTPFYPETVIRHLVYNGRGSDVEATIVDGQVLMSGGVVRTVDEADVIARAQETA